MGLVVAINHDGTAPIRPRTINQRKMCRPPALSLDTARRRNNSMMGLAQNDRRRAHSGDAGDVISRGFEGEITLHLLLITLHLLLRNDRFIIISHQ